MKSPLLVQGHHGLGDNLHQRGVIRQLMQHHEVWLETSWASLYHDMIQDGLHVIGKPTSLRTQCKNAQRPSERALFSPQPPPRTPRIRLHYHGSVAASTKSQTILEAMCRCAPGTSYENADYSLPIPGGWFKLIADLPIPDNRPVLIYRPLVARREWRGSEKRNAQPNAYAQLFASIRAGFFVVSIADLVPNMEWIVGPHLKADLELHAGELSFEALAALFAYADLTYTSSGFAAVLALAVNTPVISIVGGYERAQWHNTKPDLYCGIEPIKPCACSRSNCMTPCTKEIDITSAADKIASFLRTRGLPVEDAKVSDLYSAPTPKIGLRA
jgi:hypothetical protein